ncbi:MAG: MCP four helix bundle domain-containing protein [Nitrospirales bacterium]
MPHRLARLRPSGPKLYQIFASLLIVGLGWLGAGALNRVDQDLKILYSEYTLAAADLAHISADVLRYRTTIIQALEAPTRAESERMTRALPDLQSRIQLNVDRYAAASLRISRSGRSEPEDLEAVRKSLDAYFSVASRTIEMLGRLWNAPSPEAVVRLRTEAELHAAEKAGPTLIQVSLALDRLLETVSAVAKEMRDEGTKTIARTRVMLIAGSILVALLNLVSIRPRETPPSMVSATQTSSDPPSPEPRPTPPLS